MPHGQGHGVRGQGQIDTFEVKVQGHTLIQRTRFSLEQIPYAYVYVYKNGFSNGICFKQSGHFCSFYLISCTVNRSR